MSQQVWERRSPPPADPRLTRLGHWQPAVPADLTAHRQELVAAVRGSGRGVDLEAVERLELAFEELTSNALRHGRRPVTAVVYSDGTSWLIEVSDGAADQPPQPAVGRDAAQGGLGLYLVARISDAHGWTADGERKTVWACVGQGRPDGSSRSPG